LNNAGKEVKEKEKGAKSEEKEKDKVIKVRISTFKKVDKIDN